MDWKENAGENPANRNYKDTVFRMLFKDRERLLELYNAIANRDYTDSGKLEIVTLESAVYMGMRNDLAFLVDMNLYLFEHQSTVNPNMPLRFLQYVSAEYEKMIASDEQHREKLVRIPAPHFVVFYNGTAKCEEKRELKLSDAFCTVEDRPKLELWVQVLNINSGFNEALKAQCSTLQEYMEYVDRVRNYAKGMPLNVAVDRALDECIRQGILREFLRQNRAEVTKMSIFEYDDEAVKRWLRKDAFDDGEAKGIIETGRDVGLPEGKILERLQEKLGISAEKAQEYLENLSPVSGA